MTKDAESGKGQQTENQTDKTPAAPALAGNEPKPAPQPAEDGGKPATDKDGGEFKLPDGSIPLEDKPEGGAGEGGQDGGGDKGEEQGEPATIDLAFPEGFEKNEELLEGFKKLAAEEGIKPEGQQKMFDHFCKAMTDAQVKSRQDLEAKIVQLDAADKERIISDPKIGGANFEKSREKVGLALSRFGSPALVKSLKMCGMANNYELFAFLQKVGDHISEAEPATGDSGARKAEKRAADVIFG